MLILLSSESRPARPRSIIFSYSNKLFFLECYLTLSEETNRQIRSWFIICNSKNKNGNTRITNLKVCLTYSFLLFLLLIGVSSFSFWYLFSFLNPIKSNSAWNLILLLKLRVKGWWYRGGDFFVAEFPTIFS